MRFLKNIWAQLHRFVLWALILTILWSWIYTFVGDTTRDKKVVIYVDAYALEQRALGLRLEEECHLPGIRMIQVRDFGYDLFGTSLNGDVYIMKESLLKDTLEQTPEKLAPISVPAGMIGYERGGESWGIRIFDPAAQHGSAMTYIQYTPAPDPEPEAYYLCFDAAGLHLASLPDAIDNAAWEAAMKLLAIDD